MRAHEFTLNEDITASSDVAVVVQPMGAIIKREDTPKDGKYKTTHKKKIYQNAYRKS